LAKLTAAIFPLQRFIPLHIEDEWYTVAFGPVQIYTLEDDFSGVKPERSKKVNTTSVSFFIETSIRIDFEV